MFWGSRRWWHCVFRRHWLLNWTNRPVSCREVYLWINHKRAVFKPHFTWAKWESTKPRCVWGSVARAAISCGETVDSTSSAPNIPDTSNTTRTRFLKDSITFRTVTSKASPLCKLRKLAFFLIQIRHTTSFLRHFFFRFLWFQNEAIKFQKNQFWSLFIEYWKI